MRSSFARVAGTLAVCLLVSGPLVAQQAPVKIDSETFGGMEARAIGPATMGGRISAMDAVAGERLTIYVGAASGGVWKSTDGGLRFKPVFDKHAQSIGAITIDPKNPKTVWVGTGETWARNSVSYGDGVYKTTDGGDSWQRLGLEATERIAKIVVDPSNSDHVLVCATGHLFDDHPDRGVYRTADGGKTWAKTLSVADDTGCADLAMDPKDPKVVYASMWQFRRLPWFFTSGGPKSGLFKSADGGVTWKPIRKGLPEGDLGRIAVAVAASKPNVVYANVEAKRTALYKSEDHGDSWTEVSASSATTSRPFYYSLLVIDPTNPDRVYKPATLLGISEDGGKTFSGGGLMGGSFHPDLHALWVNPKNPEEILLGTDGGLYHSYDRANTWRFAAALPVSQFYHVSVDMEFPYDVYGGLQDNSTWYGPSRKSGGIGNKEWRSLTGGDGFWAFVDPNEPDYVYSEYQGGNLFRSRKSTGEQKDIKPSPREGEPKYRFNWNTPIHLSPTNRGTMYYGAQFLFRSRDRGESWERISPELTTNDPAKQKQDESGGLTLDNSTAENHCTIFAIAESPKNPDVIWAGTDDGNLQVTRDGGKTWTNVAGNVAGVRARTWVSSVEPSRYAEGTAYATFDGHMTGDKQPYVFKTTDFGQSWQSLVSDGLKGYAHVVREDLVNPGLLFVGTELGLFASLDGGKQWGQFTANLPNVAVRDLAIHPRDHDLVIATHGRGVYVLDDITPLRALTTQALEADAAMLPGRPQVTFIGSADFGGAMNGDAEFVGRDLGEQAYITYYLKRRHMFGDLKLEVYDTDGKLLSTISGSKRRGINRVTWPMRSKTPRTAAGAGIIPSFGAFVGPRAPHGTYTVKLIKDKDTYTGQVSLVPDPRSTHTPGDRAAQYEMAWQLYALHERLTFTVESIAAARDQARDRAGKLPEKNALRKRLEALAESLETQRKALVASKEGEGISGEEKPREEIGTLYGNVNVYEGRPTESQRQRMGVLGKQLDAAAAAFEATLAKEGAAANRELAKRKLPPLTRLTREEWDKRGSKS